MLSPSKNISTFFKKDEKMAKKDGIRISCGLLPHEEIIIYPPNGEGIEITVNGYKKTCSGHKKVKTVLRQEGRGQKNR